MKTAMTLVTLVAVMFSIETLTSHISVGRMLGTDFLNVDSPDVTARPQPKESPEVEANSDVEEIADDWIETLRRRRTRRQSRFV